MIWLYFQRPFWLLYGKCSINRKECKLGDQGGSSFIGPSGRCSKRYECGWIKRQIEDIYFRGRVNGTCWCVGYGRENKRRINENSNYFFFYFSYSYAQQDPSSRKAVIILKEKKKNNNRQSASQKTLMSKLEGGGRKQINRFITTGNSPNLRQA